MKYSPLMFKELEFYDGVSLRPFVSKPVDVLYAYDDLLEMVKSTPPGYAVSLNTWYTLIGLPELLIGEKYTFPPKPEMGLFISKTKYGKDAIVVYFKNLNVERI